MPTPLKADPLEKLSFEIQLNQCNRSLVHTLGVGRRQIDIQHIVTSDTNMKHVAKI